MFHDDAVCPFSWPGLVHRRDVDSGRPVQAVSPGGGWWPYAGAILLLATGQLSFGELGHAVGEGTDVYLFLIGMMLIAELARTTGLFDWVAALAVRRAQGSAARLFIIVYVVGTVVTVFMSNDATAVVLTPAVLAAARTAKLEQAAGSWR